MQLIPTGFTSLIKPTFPAPRHLETFHGFQQPLIVLQVSHWDVTKLGRRFNHATWSSIWFWVSRPAGVANKTRFNDLSWDILVTRPKRTWKDRLKAHDTNAEPLQLGFFHLEKRLGIHCFTHLTAAHLVAKRHAANSSEKRSLPLEVEIVGYILRSFPKICDYRWGSEQGQI